MSWMSGKGLLYWEVHDQAESLLLFVIVIEAHCFSTLELRAPGMSLSCWLDPSSHLSSRLARKAARTRFSSSRAPPKEFTNEWCGYEDPVTISRWIIFCLKYLVGGQLQLHAMNPLKIGGGAKVGKHLGSSRWSIYGTSMPTQGPSCAPSARFFLLATVGFSMLVPSPT